MSSETEGLSELEADLRSAPARLRADIGPVVAKGALNIKQQIKNDFRGSAHFGSTKPGGVIQNIRYNRKDTADSVEAEIAPFVDSGGVGGLTGIALYGGSRGGGGTVADPIIALQAEAPKFTDALADLAAEVLDD